MDSQINISGISIIDVLLILILIWAIFRGYQRGPIVHALSLLTVIAGIAVSGSLSTEITDFIRQRSTVSLSNIEIYIFAILFSATLWLSNLVADKAEKASSVSLKKPVNIILGILTSSIKYLYIVSIILLFLTQSHVLSSKQERKSRFYKTVQNTAPTTIRTVTFLK
ncbi:MAG: CvpA family protein [Chlorobi bacterium]|nr:CvpA family protein [Chlorobiota bacterium]